MTYCAVFNVACNAEADSKDNNEYVIERCLKEKDFDSKLAVGQERKHCSFPETIENLSGNNFDSETFQDALEDMNFKLNQ